MPCTHAAGLSSRPWRSIGPRRSAQKRTCMGPALRWASAQAVWAHRLHVSEPIGSTKMSRLTVASYSYPETSFFFLKRTETSYLMTKESHILVGTIDWRLAQQSIGASVWNGWPRRRRLVKRIIGLAIKSVQMGSGIFSFFWLIFSHKILLNQSKSARPTEEEECIYRLVLFIRFSFSTPMYKGSFVF